MIVSFTGAQSTGKTTLLKAVKLDERFRKFSFIDEVTRLVKKKYNLSINEEGDDLTQLAILSTHLDNYLTFRGKDVVLDRCILDGLVYTAYLNNIGKVKDEVAEYAELLTNTLINKIDIIFYTEPDIPLVDDGERSIDVEFRNKIIDLFEEAIDHYKLNVVRLRGSVDNRLELIYNIIDNYGKSNIR